MTIRTETHPRSLIQAGSRPGPSLFSQSWDTLMTTALTLHTQGGRSHPSPCLRTGPGTHTGVLTSPPAGHLHTWTQSSHCSLTHAHTHTRTTFPVETQTQVAHWPSKWLLDCSCIFTRHAAPIHTTRTDTRVGVARDPLHTHCGHAWTQRTPRAVHAHTALVGTFHPITHDTRTTPSVRSPPHSHPHMRAHTRRASLGGVAPRRTGSAARSPPPAPQPPLSCHQLPLGHLPLAPRCLSLPPRRGGGHGGGGVQTHGAQDTHMCPACGRS